MAIQHCSAGTSGTASGQLVDQRQWTLTVSTLEEKNKDDAQRSRLDSLEPMQYFMASRINFRLDWLAIVLCTMHCSAHVTQFGPVAREAQGLGEAWPHSRARRLRPDFCVSH